MVEMKPFQNHHSKVLYANVHVGIDDTLEPLMVALFSSANMSRPGFGGAGNNDSEGGGAPDFASYEVGNLLVAVRGSKVYTELVESVNSSIAHWVRDGRLIPADASTIVNPQQDAAAKAAREAFEAAGGYGAQRTCEKSVVKVRADQQKVR